jgi:hypothetical protein
MLIDHCSRHENSHKLRRQTQWLDMFRLLDIYSVRLSILVLSIFFFDRCVVLDNIIMVIVSNCDEAPAPLR